jgi:hypothetical protein
MLIKKIRWDRWDRRDRNASFEENDGHCQETREWGSNKGPTLPSTCNAMLVARYEAIQSLLVSHHSCGAGPSLPLQIYSLTI